MLQMQQQRLIGEMSNLTIQEEKGSSPPSIFASNIYNEPPMQTSEYSNQYPMTPTIDARYNPRHSNSKYSNSHIYKSPIGSNANTNAATQASGGEKNLVNQFRKKSLGPKAIHNTFNQS